MNPYYENLLKMAGMGPNALSLQKTPDQIAQEQEAQMYQIFLTTKEGVDAMAFVKTKFSEWHAANYGNKRTAANDEVKDLKEIMSKMAAQNEMMAKQIESLTNQLK